MFPVFPAAVRSDLFLLMFKIGPSDPDVNSAGDELPAAEQSESSYYYFSYNDGYVHSCL